MDSDSSKSKPGSHFFNPWYLKSNRSFPLIKLQAFQVLILISVGVIGRSGLVVISRCCCSREIIP